MKLTKLASIALGSALVFGSHAFAQDVEINGSLVLQAASVQNQVTLANDDSCAETTINQIGRSRGC